MILVLSLNTVFGQNKTALVIGNGEYAHFSKLSDPKNEAISMKNALQRLGFEVILLLDGTEDQILDAFYDFGDRIDQRGGLALFYYGGHGIPVKDSNYIIPVDADIPNERNVKSRAVDIDEIITALDDSGSETNIVILDACRDNPLPGGSRSGTKGLAVVGNQPPDSVIVYSADAGTTAVDGLFTPILLKYLETPGLDFYDLLKKVRTDVRTASGGKQRTGDYNQLESDIYLAGRPVRTPGFTEEAYNFVFVQGGTFQMGSNVSMYEKPIHSVTVSSFYMSKYEVTQGEYKELTGNNPSDTERRIGNNYPVNKVSWYEAVEYCNKLSRKEGLTPAYSGSGESIRCNFNATGYRLPTEAEWEYAAMGGASIS